MKKMWKPSFILLLILTLVFLMLPTASLAANDEAVLTAIRFEDAVEEEVSVDDSKSVTFMVPYGYGETCDLSNGLELVYDTSVYSLASPSFPNGSDAEVDGAALTMVVTYQNVSDTLSTYTSTYQISVEEASYIDPTFSGTITKAVTLPSTLTFSATDFTGKYDANNGEDLGYIKIDGSNPSFGMLMLEENTYDLGDELIALADISSGNLTFSATDSGTVSYTVTAYAADDTSDAIGTAILTITVNAATASDITYTTDEDEAVDFLLSDFSTACTNAIGGTLSYVQFTLPSSSYATLYYNYTSSSSYDSKVSSTTEYYRSSSPYLSKVTFVPYSGYTGTVTISYTGYNTDGDSYTGKIKVTVEESEVDTITYSTDEDEEVTFSVSDFNEVCDDATDENLSYVKFTLPSSSYGKLYYNYTSSSSYDSKVSSTTKYYRSSSPYLSKVTFVPYSGYTGTVTITYTGYNTDGDSYTGKIKITVEESEVDTITYSTDEDEEVTFSVSDFNEVCDDATDDNLSYVKFTLPSSSYGKLYYNYTSSSSYDSKVSSTTKYYRSSSPYLSKVTFVPYSGYSGTVTITYTGYNTDGDSYTGKIKITVDDDSSDVDTITYSTDEDEEVTFSVSDFNEVCDDATDENLSYVKFTLPSSSYGKLYYNYTSSSSYDSKVSSTTKYYRSSSPYLSKVTFVPYSGYSGTVTITYTGYNTDGDSYTGKIKITVGDDSSADTITYTTNTNGTVPFLISDFNTVCEDVTDDTLSYVKFTLPSSSYGKLYYGYSSSSSYDSAVSSTTKYYYKSSSPYLSQVTFVPYSGYTGTVTINYTGYNTDGDSYTGKVSITVTGNTSGYFSDVGTKYSWAAEAIDYLYNKSIVTGVSAGKYNPASNITRSDLILLLYKAFNLSTATSSGNFADVAKGTYYYDAVATAKSLGIAKGSGTNFNPTAAITRQDVMVLVVRTLNISGYTLTAGTSSDLSAYSDSGLISDYASSAVATLVKAKIIQGNANKLNPQNNITRAEMAVLLYRILITYGS